MTTNPPRLQGRLLHELNRLAAQRARSEALAVWHRHQRALHATAIDLLIAGRSEDEVLAELMQAAAEAA